ncbi:MAG: CoA ester lyase, partial [Leucobacter sp.]|nr:CoA ester lyase [Leucobacter sp.]
MHEPTSTVATRPESYLFVPGARPDRFEKAIASAADRVIIDLEDAVEPAEKQQARDAIRAALAAGLEAPVLVRINAQDSPWFEDDLRMLSEVQAAHPGVLAGVVLPKIESVDAAKRVRAAFGDAAHLMEFIGLIESALGVVSLVEIARSGVTRLGVGAVDLSVDLYSEVQSPTVDYVYAQVVIASRVAGIEPPIGSPPLEIHDAAGIEARARSLKAMGIAGQRCIHP